MPGRCGAKLKNSNRKYGHQRYCKKWPYNGSSSGRCEMCGGKTPHGIGLPQFKGAGYSKYIGRADLRKVYEETQNDPALMSLTEEITIAKTRLKELLTELDSERQTKRISQVVLKTKRALKRSRKSPLTHKDLRSLGEAVQALDASRDVDKVWRGVGTWSDRLCKLVDTERRLQYEEHRSILAGRMLELQTMTLTWIRNVIMGWDGRKVVANKMLQDAQAQFTSMFGVQTAEPRNVTPAKLS